MSDKERDVLLQLARDQEQLETAVEALGKMTTRMFHELVSGGMTRAEALEMAKTIVPAMLNQARN